MVGRLLEDFAIARGRCLERAWLLLLVPVQLLLLLRRTVVCVGVWRHLRVFIDDWFKICRWLHVGGMVAIDHRTWATLQAWMGGVLVAYLILLGRQSIR